MGLVEIKDKKTAKQFISFPRKLYKGDPNFISPLETDIEAIFDQERNPYFRHGECTRWILLNDNGEVIGRIAAFINTKKADKYEQPTGGIGFFECINDQKAANVLFDAGRNWLKERGMKAMDGPINFGENDKFWGLLIDGFKPPSLGMNYNPPYYQKLFESYGFEKGYDQLTNFIDVKSDMTERMRKISEWVMKKPGYNFRPFAKNEFEKFAKDFCEIYNDAWKDFEDHSTLDIPTVKESFRQMKPIMDEKIIWFAYYEDEPIAFLVCIPDVNQWLKHVNGRLNFLGKLKFLWYRKTVTVERIRIIVMGCKQKYQNKGIESALVRCLREEIVPRNTWKGVELSWVGDFNTKMLALHEATGAKKDKVHRTYRYLFP